jgi:hypothetical protein
LIFDFEGGVLTRIGTNFRMEEIREFLHKSTKGTKQTGGKIFERKSR